MNKRISQINELIRSLIGKAILEEIELPLGSLVTVVKVDTAPDLKTTIVNISILPDNRSLSIFEFLNKKIVRIQRYVGKNLSLRNTPRITFKLDFTERRASHMDQVLDSLQ
ncbi:MAG: ribosome-binding factor A [Patescibacteria group bacterium]